MAELEGERKLVTIVFADLSGFTALSERLDPEEVRGLVNDCFSALVPVIEGYGGTIDKFIGDEVMALFGAPAAHEDDAEAALRAALSMMAELQTFNTEHDTGFGMHIGVDTGVVVTGGLGAEGREQYSVMGDAVNLASRLEDASKTGQILVGPLTYRLISHLFEFCALAPLSLKGKAEPVPVYELLSAKSRGAETRGGLVSPLVGRERELDVLRRRLQRLVGGAGGLVAVSGEPGIGKSRLLAEARVAAESSVLWVEGRGQLHGENVSYAAAIQVLDGLIDVESGSPPPTVRSALTLLLRRLMPEAPWESEVYPYLARLHDLPLDLEAAVMLGELVPEALQERMWRAFTALVDAVCKTRPLVLVWEDLHWIDPSSLGLLEYLLSHVRDLPLLVLVSFRVDEGESAAWYQRLKAAVPDVATLISLPPLSSEESAALARNLLRVDSLPEAAKHRILEAAEGNPFFLEELLRSLVESGLVLFEGDRALARGDLEQLEVPHTVQAVVAARIDRLPPADKQVLQDASVIGRVFQRPVLAYLEENVRQRPINDLPPHLEELEHRELIRRREEPEYIFKHAVTHEVTYSSLLRARRRQPASCDGSSD